MEWLVVAASDVRAIRRSQGGADFRHRALGSVPPCIRVNTVSPGSILVEAMAGRVTASPEHQPIIEPALWDAVRGKLAANSVERGTGERVRRPGLLAGLLYDGGGHRMTPPTRSSRTNLIVQRGGQGGQCGTARPTSAAAGFFTQTRSRFFKSGARAKRLKNPFNLSSLRGGDQRRQGHLAMKNPISGHFCGVR